MEVLCDQYPRDAAGLVAGYHLGSFSPVDVVADCLRRIERDDQRIGAFVCLSSTALEEARESAARYAAGRTLGPLDGVPIAVKDNIAVRGLPATWGCPHYSDYVPDSDELPVARLREGGLIILGKTNVREFTLESTPRSGTISIPRRGRLWSRPFGSWKTKLGLAPLRTMRTA